MASCILIELSSLRLSQACSSFASPSSHLLWIRWAPAGAPFPPKWSKSFQVEEEPRLGAILVAVESGIRDSQPASPHYSFLEFAKPFLEGAGLSCGRASPARFSLLALCCLSVSAPPYALKVSSYSVKALRRTAARANKLSRICLVDSCERLAFCAEYELQTELVFSRVRVCVGGEVVWVNAFACL